MILSRGDRVELDDLPAALAVPAAGAPDVALGALVPLEAIEQAHLRLVTARTSTLEEAARVLGIDAATIYRKRKRWAADPAAESTP